ncbi:hypothetical protein NQZ70_06265 [Sorangium sp. Soce836]|nr:hypothetical protein NQZ70_06265 [Sorangium sp. Soce836]
MGKAEFFLLVLQWGRRLSAAERTLEVNPFCVSNELQWGRRLSAAERDRHAEEDQGRTRASMGPPPFSGGEDEGSIEGFFDFVKLQWGRRLSAAERRGPGEEALAEVQVASMGPPPFSGGEHGYPESRHQIDDSLQWGRRLSAAERIGGAAERLRHDWLQWGRRLSAAERRGSVRARMSSGCVGFNGAAAFQRRRGARLLCRDTFLDPASMGPPPFSGGEHALVALDPEARGASMGPPPFSGGEFTVVDQSPCRRCELQWGRRLSAAERGGGVAMRDAIPELLQWGRRLSAAERSLDYRTDLRASQACFNGAAAFQRRRGLRCACNRALLLHAASMGPPPFSGGEAQAR